MWGSYGSFRQRLKQYRINLKNKKKKEEREKPKKIKNILFIPFVFITSLLGYAFSSPIKKEKIKESSKSQLKKIEAKLDEAKTLDSVFEIKKEYVSIKPTIPKTKENKEMISKIDSKVEETVTRIKENIEYPQPVNEELKLTNHPVSISKEEKSIETVPAETLENPILDEKKEVEIIKKFDYEFCVIDETRKLKDIIESLEKVEEKIASATEYNELYDYERKLKEIQIKIEKIKNEYQILSKNSEFKQAFDSRLRYYDEFDLYTNDSSIDRLLDQTKEDLKTIDKVKAKILDPQVTTVKKEEKVTQTKKENKPKEEKKKEKKDEKKNDKLIIDTLLNNQNMRLTKVTNSKQPKLNKLREISFIGLSYLFSPFRLFNNPLLSSIITGIAINNSLKTMRKVLDSNYELNYTIYQYQSLIDVTLEGINEVNLVRNELLKNYHNEDIIDILEQIDTIEHRYIEQYENLTHKKQKILRKAA